jgi:hypothetical protein
MQCSCTHPCCNEERLGDEMNRVYIAGKMTGLPGYGYDAFHAAAKQLRELGYHVENPAENPAPADGKWESYMRMAIAQLVTCDEIHMLRGWATSKGATIERKLAEDLGLVITGAPA